MNKLYNKLCKLIDEDEVLISEHGYTELAEDSLPVKELINGIKKATIVEEYL